MKKMWNKYRSEAKRTTVIFMHAVFALVKLEGPAPLKPLLPEIEYTPHAGVSYFLSPKSDLDDVPYHFDANCWAPKIVPELKHSARTYAWRTTDFSKRSFEGFLASMFPKNARPDAIKTLKLALPWAEKYCLDPLWVASLIFTESSFRTSLRSVKEAYGPLQLIPETGRLLSRKLLGVEDPGISSLLVKTPETNIRLGLYYFRRVLNFFNGNYELATVAYNMGPWWVRAKLDAGPYHVNGHQYFERIRAQYASLMAQYFEWAQNGRPEYSQTLVARVSTYSDFEIESFLLAQNLSHFLAEIDRILGQSQIILLAQHER